MDRKIAATLKRHGYKLTTQRRAVLDVLVHSQGRLTPAAVYEMVHQEHPSIGLVTIYRTLEILAKIGLICEVHARGNGRSYILRRASEHHHHLICSDCGAVIDFSDCDLGDLEQTLSLETGFEIESHILEFLGRCRNCQKIASA
ncbi:MAG: Fur family transcriptional regulator [Dehalococcoidia bacterium DG_18]|nr:MAG: Fur family transcriptional regulator [Dehalococcoidia bacterium DG_18]